MKRVLHFIIPVCVALMALASCLKKDYDVPPDQSGYDPKLSVTHTIEQLLKLNGPYDRNTDGDTTLIPAGVTITGIVTADDRSGNFFKRIVIDDGSAGITVLIDAYSLYNDYPAGRRVYIKCGGLYLGYDGGLPVLGGKPSEHVKLEGIKGADVAVHIVKGPVGNPVIPDTLDLILAEAANPALYNRLITIREVQFADPDKSYTQPNATTNRDIMDCNGSSIVVRSSNYADFASFPLPAGKGYITGIYTVYVGSEAIPQLVIRDTTDVHFDQPRCGSGPSSPTARVSIDSVRKLYAGGAKALSNFSIKGIVISDRANGNTDGRNVILQDGSRGIVVRFTGNSHSFDPGDEVIVNVNGAPMSEYNGLLQIGGSGSFPASKASRQSTGNTVTPAVLTIAQLTGSNFEQYESTLVRIMNANISGGSKYGDNRGSKSITDASNNSGSLKLYTLAGASFAGATVPSGPVNITAIVGQFSSTKQLSIRSTADVQ